jgi:shikimate kinase
MSSPGHGAETVAGSVVLVGFMGAGKSTVGRALAAGCGLPFVDCDEVIEREHGPIDVFFAARGERAFRVVEEDVVLRVLGEAQTSAMVVALGGGAVTSESVRRRLERFAHVVWLEAPLDALWRRAGGGERAARPLARDRQEFGRLLEERRPLYAEASRVRVSVASGDVPHVVEEIVLRTGLCAGRSGGDA